MDSEMASWRSTDTYVDTVPLPGANIFDGMWIFKVKRPPGSPPNFKACYMARGFSQREGVYFFQTFSPTPKMTTLRVLLHFAAQRDNELHSLDSSIAFLQGRLHKEIWLRPPPGFTGNFSPGTQWSLRQPVYGLRQVPHEWHDTMRSTLADLGFRPFTADSSLFVRYGPTPFFVLVYVDDLVFATADRVALAEVKSKLQKRHTCTDLGQLRRYLGLQITTDRGARTVTLTQSHMVQQVLQQFGFQFSTAQPTPLAVDHRLTTPISNECFESSGPYAELVGCLMYLSTCTRPDLAYPLSILARFVATGRHQPVHWTAAVRVANYPATTSGMGLVLGGTQLVVLTGHCDSSFADVMETQRSTKGYCFSLGSVALPPFAAPSIGPVAPRRLSPSRPTIVPCRAPSAATATPHRALPRALLHACRARRAPAARSAATCCAPATRQAACPTAPVTRLPGLSRTLARPDAPTRNRRAPAARLQHLATRPTACTDGHLPRARLRPTMSMLRPTTARAVAPADDAMPVVVVRRRACNHDLGFSYAWLLLTVFSSTSGCPLLSAAAVPLLTPVMPSELVLWLDAEGQAIDFGAWLLDVQLRLQSQLQDDAYMYAHVSGELFAHQRPPVLTAEPTLEERKAHRMSQLAYSVWCPVTLMRALLLVASCRRPSGCTFARLRRRRFLATPPPALPLCCALSCPSSSLTSLLSPLSMTLLPTYTHLTLASALCKLLTTLLRTPPPHPPPLSFAIASITGAKVPPIFEGCTLPQLPTPSSSAAVAETTTIAKAATISASSRGRGQRWGGRRRGGAGGVGTLGGAGAKSAGSGGASAGGATVSQQQQQPQQEHQQQQQLQNTVLSLVSYRRSPLSLPHLHRHAPLVSRAGIAPHSSSFPPTTVPLQTLRMGVWGPDPRPWATPGALLPSRCGRILPLHHGASLKENGWLARSVSPLPNVHSMLLHSRPPRAPPLSVLLLPPSSSLTLFSPPLSNFLWAIFSSLVTDPTTPPSVSTLIANIADFASIRHLYYAT
ncbi:unnamed protein product [Closterium sp. NIES-54]